MRTFLLLTLSLISLTARSQQQSSGWSNKSRLLPDKLRLLPVGLTLWHTNNPCIPVLEGDTYYWKHATMVRAEVSDLELVEAGSFIWYDSTGWHPNMRYNPAEFAATFVCPQGKLQRGQTYTYPKNWRYGKQAYGGDALWYVIAKDRSGKRYKGYGLIETEGKPNAN
ncbi:hypothetical protein [Spirosoma fluviale]|uniref:Uncharacterized protein n=1 Tax=Spirosoma fluviale TaxID=1597977 RepID=A0A286GAD4_9BACT|nr:hypothetical protein [Spirosoma fluviale]SOD92099.1 hypothetical protein SAMN06269250_3798 [Spirosoma fluviale]